MGFVNDIKDAVTSFFGDPKPGDPPSWLKRLKKASYKSPSGQVVPFEFADLESTFGKKTTAFDNAIGDGTYIQDNGKISSQHPMSAAFSGDNYDLKAQAFLSAVLEPGPGTLTHPIYGDITVVPFGEISRSDALVSAGNQAVFTLSFYETTGLNIGGAEDVPQLFDAFMDASAVDFADKVDLSDVSDAKNFATKATATIKKTVAVMKKISSGIAKVQSAVEGIGDSLLRGVDLFVGQPLMMARQLQVLIGEPARQFQSIKAKLDGYANMAAGIFSQTFSEENYEKVANKNAFHFAKLNAGANVAAMALVSAGNAAPSAAGATELVTRADFIHTADNLRAQLESIQAWQDASFVALVANETQVDQAATDSGSGSTELAQLVSAAMAQLITASFDARTAYSFELQSDRTPLDLCFEWYGSTDQLNFLCDTNDLSGPEHFMIPKGRRVVRYL